MKILIVASNMVHIKNFHLPYIEAFKHAGHDVLVMANGEGADFNVPFKKKAFSFSNFKLSLKIKKILKNECFDAIFLHTTLAAFWTRFAMRGLKKKPIVVNTVHGYLFSKHTSGLKTSLYLLAEKLMRKRTDYIAVMNKEDLDIAVTNKLCKKDVVFINGMGVKPDRVLGIQKGSKNDNSLRLVYVGELSARKNQIFLVKALRYLENAHLTLVGDGDERESIEKYAKENGLSSRLTITGFTKNVKAYLENSDVYVSASVIEGLPFNLIEAMIARMPILASDIKGQRDLLSSNCLYPLNDMNAFVDALKNVSLESIDYDIDKYLIDNALNENMSIYLGFLKE